jgi:hypothetical protein
MMSSKPGLKKANWKSAAGWLFKGIIVLYYALGNRKDSIGECFRRHVPRNVYVPIIGQDVTDNAIEQRGHKGYDYEPNKFEHVDKHPLGMKMLPFARKIVNEGLILTRADIDKIVSQALSSTEEIKIEQTTMDNEKKRGGVFYVLGNGSINCGLGISFQKDFTKRTDSFKKGDVENTLIVQHAIWLEDPRPIETEVKRHLSEFSIGNERYKVHADHAIHVARHYADKHKIPYYNVKLET